MRKLLLPLLAVALVFSFSDADAAFNFNAKYAMHFAGPHDAKGNTCDFAVLDCAGEIVETAIVGAGNYDVYVLAVDVYGIAGVRYGVRCETAVGLPPLMMGWTPCSDFEIPEAGWPACGTSNAQTWVGEQPGPHVTVGILDVYVYPGTNAKMCADVDYRVGFAEFCDGSSPVPLCNRYQADDDAAYGCVGFNRKGYNPCSEVSTDSRSWGAVKSLYR
jgi:hypothetical protein